MDDADWASHFQQSMIDAKIKTSNNLAGQVKIEGDGVCIECDSAVAPVEFNGKRIAGRFCSTECRDAHDKYQKLFG